MNHYISQLSEVFSKGELAQQKLNKINVLKCAASYMRKIKGFCEILKEQEENKPLTSLSFLSNQELESLTLDV